MSVAKKLKWRRALSRLTFCYDELEYTRESAKASAPEFEAYYRKFCAEHNIDGRNERQMLKVQRDQGRTHERHKGDQPDRSPNEAPLDPSNLPVVLSLHGRFKEISEDAKHVLCPNYYQCAETC